MSNCYYCEAPGSTDITGEDGIPRWVCGPHVEIAKIDDVDDEERMREVELLLKHGGDE